MASAAAWASAVTCPVSVTCLTCLFCLCCSCCWSFLVPVAGGVTRCQRCVVDRAGGALVVLLAEQREIVDAGGAGAVIAGQGLGAGLGVGVPGDVVRGGGPGVLAA